MARYHSWMALPERLLKTEGKNIVSEDPYLSSDTINALMSLYGNTLDRYTFYFGTDDSSDIGLVNLSMCIMEDPDATMAEVVGRYAEMRGIPFLETAIAVIRHSKEYGIYLYLHNDVGYYQKLWFPKTSSDGIRPPGKRAV